MPPFGTRLRALRQERGLSLRQLGALVHYSYGYLADLEHGRKWARPEIAEALDKALAATGELVQLQASGPVSVPTPLVDEERLAYVATKPHAVDTETLNALTTVLAAQRRLEDTIGALGVLEPVCAQLATVEQLVQGTPERLRRPTVKLASQWAQFGGWLHTTTGRHTDGRAWYLRAMEWGTEAGDADMVATALSMRGHLAWIRGEHGQMLDLSRSAQWPPARLAVVASAAQQEARALALLGDSRGCDDALTRAENLAHAATSTPDSTPPWMYFYNTQMLTMQRGLAQLLLGRHERAATLLETGLQQLSPDVRRSDWVGYYVVRLAEACRTLDPMRAAAAVDEAADIATATRSARLTGEIAQVERLLDGCQDRSC